MSYPKDLKYSKTHEWVKDENGTCIVGITEYAQKELSDVVYVELPEEGREVSKGEAVCVVESVKAAFDIYSPVSGKVVAINEGLEDDPALVNSDCYGDGWFFKLEASNASEIEAMMDADAYASSMSE